MKKTLYILVGLLALAFSALSFGACEKNDPEDESSMLIEVPGTVDDLSYFQNAIAPSYEGGYYYAYGEALYPNDPEHLYIGVNNIAEAKEFFMGWMAPDVEKLEDGDAITCSLSDEEGNAQGIVYFIPGSGSTVADVVVSNGTRIRYFNKITFLLNSAWPYNSADSKWKKFDVVKKVQADKDTQFHFGYYQGDCILDLVCVHEAGNGVKPLFIAIGKGTGRKCGDSVTGMEFDQFRASGYMPNLEKAQEISKILRKDWNLFSAVFKSIDINLGEPCWIDHTHRSGVLFYDYVYLHNNPDELKTFMYGAKAGGKGNHFLYAIDWYGDSEMKDGITLERSYLHK